MGRDASLDDLDVDPARLLCLPAAEPVLARAAEAKSGAALGFLLLDLKAWVEAARELLHKALVHPLHRDNAVHPVRDGHQGCGVGAPDVGQGPGLVHHLPEAGKGVGAQRERARRRNHVETIHNPDALKHQVKHALGRRHRAREQLPRPAVPLLAHAGLEGLASPRPWVGARTHLPLGGVMVAHRHAPAVPVLGGAPEPEDGIPGLAQVPHQPPAPLVSRAVSLIKPRLPAAADVAPEDSGAPRLRWVGDGERLIGGHLDHASGVVVAVEGARQGRANGHALKADDPALPSREHPAVLDPGPPPLPATSDDVTGDRRGLDEGELVEDVVEGGAEQLRRRAEEPPPRPASFPLGGG